MTTFTAKQKLRVNEYAELLMISSGISRREQRLLINLGRIVFRNRLHLLPSSAELIEMRKAGEPELQDVDLDWLTKELLPRSFETRTVVDLGPVLIKQYMMEDGLRYGFLPNNESLKQIEQFEDRLLAEKQ